MTQPAQPAPKENSLAEAHRRRATLILGVVAALFVLVPFLFWRGTWFGRPLTEEEFGEYLADREKPRHIQHALAQIGERIERGDLSVRRWYPQVLALRASPIAELRITLAWLLGTDNRSEQFHQALLELLRDPEPLVRRNAALSLVRFGDASGKQEILQMLRSPEEGQAWEALRALFLVGQPEDLAAVEEFARSGANQMSQRIQQQAALTAAELRRRASQRK